MPAVYDIMRCSKFPHLEGQFKLHFGFNRSYLKRSPVDGHCISEVNWGPWCLHSGTIFLKCYFLHLKPVHGFFSLGHPPERAMITFKRCVWLRKRKTTTTELPKYLFFWSALGPIIKTERRKASMEIVLKWGGKVEVVFLSVALHCLRLLKCTVCYTIQFFGEGLFCLLLSYLP